MSVKVSPPPAPQPPFPVLEIKAFVDESTAVLVGPQSSTLKEGDELYILGIGDTNIPGTDVPLISPKAKLEVSFPAGVYVLAQSPLRHRESPTSSLAQMAAISEIFKTTVSYRPSLTRDEKQFIGNPGTRPVAVGDVVVPTKHLGDYIKWRAEQVAKR